jgi:hypothetical protein
MNFWGEEMSSVRKVSRSACFVRQHHRRNWRKTA